MVTNEVNARTSLLSYLSGLRRLLGTEKEASATERVEGWCAEIRTAEANISHIEEYIAEWKQSLRTGDMKKAGHEPTFIFRVCSSERVKRLSKLALDLLEEEVAERKARIEKLESSIHA